MFTPQLSRGTWFKTVTAHRRDTADKRVFVMWWDTADNPGVLQEITPEKFQTTCINGCPGHRGLCLLLAFKGSPSNAKLVEALSWLKPGCYHAFKPPPEIVLRCSSRPSPDTCQAGLTRRRRSAR